MFLWNPAESDFALVLGVRGDRCPANRILAVDGGPREGDAGRGVDRVGDRAIPCRQIPMVLYIYWERRAPEGSLSRARLERGTKDTEISLFPDGHR